MLAQPAALLASVSLVFFFLASSVTVNSSAETVIIAHAGPDLALKGRLSPEKSWGLFAGLKGRTGGGTHHLPAETPPRLASLLRLQFISVHQNVRRTPTWI